MADIPNTTLARDCNEAERWLPVPGYEGHYEVSDRGRVRTLARVISRRMGDGSVQDQLRPEKILAQVTYGGRWYPRVTLTVNHKKKTVSVHTLILTAFVGPAPVGMQCRHLDGDLTNTRLSNLTWGTPKENTADKFRHGTVLRGEKVRQASLTADEVRIIRRRHAAGELQYRMAREYGVSKATVCRVIKGKCWGHVR